MNCRDSVQTAALVGGRSEAVRRHIPQTAAIELHRLTAAWRDHNIRDDLVAREPHLFDARAHHVGDVLRHLAAMFGVVHFPVEKGSADTKRRVLNMCSNQPRMIINSMTILLLFSYR